MNKKVIVQRRITKHIELDTATEGDLNIRLRFPKAKTVSDEYFVLGEVKNG